MARDSQAWLSAPTLIYGPRKAGTTLFLRLVDTNGDLEDREQAAIRFARRAGKILFRSGA